jgi:hypothetical protein
MGRTRDKQLGDQTKVFIPFPQANSAQHIQSSQGWRNVAPLDIFCIDDVQLQNHLSALQGPRDVLYIRGHCAPGMSELESSDHTVRVSYTEVVKALKGNLPTGFPGIIKIYACNSASDASLLWITWKSFAQQFANMMWEKRYRSCKIWAYTKKVTTFASPGASGIFHKWVGDPDVSPDEESGPDPDRASLALVRILPELKDSVLPL